MAISPPPGYVKDPNSEDWYFDPTGDPNRKETWWQHPPAGFVPDPNNQGWYYDPSKDVAHDPSAWFHDNTIIDDPATKALSFWSLEEIGVAAERPVNPNVSDNWPHICRAAGQWGIDEPIVLIGFLGTMRKETGSLYPVREAWWVWDKDQQAAIRYYLDTSKHAAYGGGWQYHGRGYTQNTHLAAYQQAQADLASKGMQVDLVNSPDLLLVPEYAAHAMCSFFIRKTGLLTAVRTHNWVETRRLVWGAYGDSEGVGYLQRCDQILFPLAQQRGFA